MGNIKNTTELAKQAVDREKEKLLEKARQEETAKQVKLLADKDIFTDRVLAAIVKAEFNSDVKPVKQAVRTKSKEEQHVLMYSDAQVGTKIIKESTGGLNEYNKDIRKMQLEKLYNTVEEIANKHKKSALVRKLNVFGLGDYVEGEGIFPGQARHVDMDIIQQAVVYARETGDLLIKLLNVYEEIEVWSIPGNHGRTNQKKGESEPWASWDNLVFMIVQQYVSNYKNITINLSMAQWQVADVLGHKFLLMHGDQIKSWNGIPFYGIKRADGAMSQLLDSIGVSYEYMCVGHFHSPAELPRVKGEILVNGCWPGGSLFAINVLMTSGTPMQKFFAVNKDQGKTYSYPIWLNV